MNNRNKFKIIAFFIGVLIGGVVLLNSYYPEWWVFVVLFFRLFIFSISLPFFVGLPIEVDIIYELCVESINQIFWAVYSIICDPSVVRCVVKIQSVIVYNNAVLCAFMDLLRSLVPTHPLLTLIFYISHPCYSALMSMVNIFLFINDSIFILIKNIYY